ncbi:M50 family metallopeptidase, partial [Vulcanococcus sp.]
MGVLTALAILAGLIVVHEAGHFFAATWQGIRVSGFSVGFGPVLLQKQRRGVQFALRAIPLGGFVSFPDDDEDSSIPSDDPDLLTNRPLPQRALVIAAGVIANLLLAWAVLMAQGAFVGIPAGFSATPGVLVSGVQQGQAAAASGLKAGDRILAVDGRDLGGGQSAVSQLVELVKGAPDQTLRLQAERQGQALELQLTPADLSGIGRIGAQLQPSGTEAFRRPRSPIEVIQQANHDVALLTKRTVDGFITLVTHFGETAGQVSGPVKIVEMGASLAKQGGSSLFLYTALISINLAVLNALP